MKISNRNSMLAAGICLFAFLGQPGIAQNAIGSLYPGNLPGDSHMPAGTFNIQQKVRELSANARPVGLVRLPNGHYLIQTLASLIGSPLVELDASLEIVRTLPQSGQFEVRGFMALDRRSGPESRVWSGGSTMVSSLDWRQLTYDPAFVQDSPYGLRFLGNCADCRSARGGMAIAEQGGQVVVVTAGAEAGRHFHYHLLGGNDSTLPDFQPPVPDTFTPPGNIKGHAAYDPILGTIWWSNLDTDLVAPDPLRFVEYELSGQLTGRIFQPELPFQPLQCCGIGGLLGADMYIDADGNRVLAFISNHSGREILAEVKADFVFGGGCNGQIDFKGEPRIGGDFEIELFAAIPGGNEIAFLWRGSPFPHFIRSIPGLNNCDLHLDLNPGSNFAIVGSEELEFGAASRTLSVPMVAALVGLELGFQWLLPTSPSGLPIDLSSAGGLRIGAAR